MSEHESSNPPGWADDEPADDREVEVELDGVADEPEPWVAGLEADADDQAPPPPPASPPPPAPASPPASPEPAARQPAPPPDDEPDTDLEDLARLAAEDDAPHGDRPEAEDSDLGLDLDALEAAVREMGLDPEQDEPGAHGAATTPEPPPARPQPPAPSDQPTSVPPPAAAPTDELASMPPPPAPPAHPDPDALADWSERDEPPGDAPGDAPGDEQAADEREDGGGATPSGEVDLQNFTAKGGSGTAGEKRPGRRRRFGR